MSDDNSTLPKEQAQIHLNFLHQHGYTDWDAEITFNMSYPAVLMCLLQDLRGEERDTTLGSVIQNILLDYYQNTGRIERL